MEKFQSKLNFENRSVIPRYYPIPVPVNYVNRHRLFRTITSNGDGIDASKPKYPLTATNGLDFLPGLCYVSFTFSFFELSHADRGHTHAPFWHPLYYPPCRSGTVTNVLILPLLLFSARVMPQIIFAVECTRMRLHCYQG